MNRRFTLDLVVLVPGKDEHEAFDALLSSRRSSLKICRIRYKILVHPRRDPGCYHEASDILQPYMSLAQYVLVVLDHEGSGREMDNPKDVAKELRDRLDRSGWSDRAEVLLLRPEFENWVWTDSPHLDRVIGWEGQSPPLRQWLRSNGRWPEGALKPPHPKECFEEALRHVRMRRTSAIYRQLAEYVSLERCNDEVFLQFKEVLRRWFPQQGESP